MKYDLITLLGPTASGKTAIATNLAHLLGAEIISADSRQVFRGMDLGTGKDLQEYVIDNSAVPFHLIDILEPGMEYNVHHFQEDFFNVFSQIKSKGKPTVMCGGTGLYIESVLSGYQLITVPDEQVFRNNCSGKSMEELAEMLLKYKIPHATSDLTKRDRLIRAIEIEKFKAENPHLLKIFPKFSSIVFGVKYERSVEKQRITQRLISRINDGMIDEVEKLINNGVSTEILKSYGLEYKFVTRFLLGEIPKNQMFEELNIAIHQFAKRQMTWFRRMEKNGITINWVDGDKSLDDKINTIKKIINN